MPSVFSSIGSPPSQDTEVSGVNNLVITVVPCPILNSSTFTYFILSDNVLEHPLSIEFHATALDGSSLVFSGKQKVQWSFKGVDTSKPITNVAGGSFRIVTKSVDQNLASFIRQVYQPAILRYLSQYPENLSEIEMIKLPMVQRFDIRKIEGPRGRFIEVHGDDAIEDIAIHQWSEESSSWSTIYRGNNNSRIAYTGEGEAKFLVQPYTLGIPEPSYKLKTLEFNAEKSIVNFGITKTGMDSFKLWTVDLVAPDFDTFTIKGEGFEQTFESLELGRIWASKDFKGEGTIEIIQKRAGSYLRSQFLEVPKSYRKESKMDLIENREDFFVFNIKTKLDFLATGKHRDIGSTGIDLGESRKIVYKLMVTEYSELGSKLHALWPVEIQIRVESSTFEIMESNAPIELEAINGESFRLLYSKAGLLSTSLYEFKLLEWTAGIEMSRTAQEPVGITFTDTGANVQATTLNFWEVQHSLAVDDKIGPPNDLQDLFFGIPKSLLDTGATPGTALVSGDASKNNSVSSFVAPTLLSMKALHDTLSDGRINTIISRIKVPSWVSCDRIDIEYSFGDEEYTLLNSFSGKEELILGHLFKEEKLELELLYRVKYFQDNGQLRMESLNYSSDSIASIRNSINSHNALVGSNS